MTYTAIPSVSNGQVIDPSWGNAVDTAVTELQDRVPENFGCNCTRTTTISLTNATATAINLLNEIEDSAGFHSGGNNVFTVPAGMGGDYMLCAGVEFDSNSTNIRAMTVTIANNTSVTNEVDTLEATAAAHVTTGVKLCVAKQVRLEAGATVSLTAYQNSGGALNVTSAFMTLTPIRMIPSLT